MHRKLLAILVPFIIAALALAANPHYVTGPSISLSGATVTATGSIAGLGNQDIDLKLTVYASQEVQCRNRGGNIAPGQTKNFTAATEQSAVRPENGRVNFSISATATPAGLDYSGACNRNWTVVPGDVTVSGATLEVYQPSGSGTVVLSNSVSF